MTKGTVLSNENSIIIVAKGTECSIIRFALSHGLANYGYLLASFHKRLQNTAVMMISNKNVNVKRNAYHFHKTNGAYFSLEMGQK